MSLLTVNDLRGLGRVESAPGAHELAGVHIDSRRIAPGDLFVAIGRGADFVDEALERGAAAAFVPDDAFAALARLGRVARERTSARVVGITGSTGKTSTKDILAALCRPLVPTVAAERGHNNEIGLPLTLMRVEGDTQVVVAEMGMRGLGQIAKLCSIAQPDVGVITNVAAVHLELLGTVERVAKAKAEIIGALRPRGTAVVPADAPLLEPYLAREDLNVTRFGTGGDVRLLEWQPPRLVAALGRERVELEVPFTARHQALNTLAALAAYRALRLPLSRAAEGAREIELSPWRGEEHELPDGVLLVNDAYNANPLSMRAALEHLVERAAGRRTVAVLGDMAELGAGARAYHVTVGEVAAELGVDVLVGVGELASGYLDGAAGVPDRRAARDASEALLELEAVLAPGDVVLVKASRAMGLEKVADGLLRTPV